jgi:hypothetical protein
LKSITVQRLKEGGGRIIGLGRGRSGLKIISLDLLNNIFNLSYYKRLPYKDRAKPY